MAGKCCYRPRYRLEFVNPTLTNDAVGQPVETVNFSSPTFRDYGYIRAGTPFELNQADKPVGQAFYMIEVRWNTNTRQISGQWQVRVPAMNNLILHVDGPITPKKDDHHWGVIKAVQHSPVSHA